MPIAIPSVPCDRPPTGYTPINRANPITRDLAYVVGPGGGWDVDDPAASYRAATHYGGGYRNWPMVNVPTLPYNDKHDVATVQLIGRFRLLSLSAWSNILAYGYYRTTTDNGRLAFAMYTTNNYVREARDDASAGWASGPAISFPSDVALDVYWPWTDSATVHHYVNGADNTMTSSATGWEKDTAKTFQTAGSSFGRTYYAMMFKRPLTIAEKTSLHNNPWQIYL